MIVTESSDLGRKGRAGATVVIFTAGMDDLRGHCFDVETDCYQAILTDSTDSKSPSDDTKVHGRKNREVPYSTHADHKIGSRKLGFSLGQI